MMLFSVATKTIYYGFPTIVLCLTIFFEVPYREDCFFLERDSIIVGKLMFFQEFYLFLLIIIIQFGRWSHLTVMVAYIIPGKFFDSRESRSPKSKIFTGHQIISWFHFFYLQSKHSISPSRSTILHPFSSLQPFFYEQKLHYSNRFILTISLQTSLQKARGCEPKKTL